MREVLVNEFNGLMIEVAAVGIDCVLGGIDTTYAFEVLEEGQNHISVGLYLWRFLAYFYSLELDDEAGIDVVFGLEYNLVLLIGEFASLGLLGLYDVDDIQILGVLSLGGVVVGWGGQAHSHEIVVIELGLGY